MKIIENLPQGILGTPREHHKVFPPLDLKKNEKLRKGKVEFTKGNFLGSQKIILGLLLAAPRSSPGAPRSSPGAPRGSTGTSRASPGAPRDSPGASRGSPGASRGSPGAPRGSQGAPRSSPGAPRSSPGAPRHCYTYINIISPILCLVCSRPQPC